MATIAEQITQIETRLAAYYAAERYLLASGQSYSIGNRSLTRADLGEIRKAIVDLNRDLTRLNRGNQITMHRVVPRDF